MKPSHLQVVLPAAFDIEAEFKRANAEHLARHYRALAEFYLSLPSPSWLRGDDCEKFREWKKEQAEMAMEQANANI